MLVFVMIFAAAGVWQIQRGQAKAVMLAQQAAARKNPAQALLPALGGSAAPSINALYGQAFAATGHYDGEHQVLLDNQISEGEAGYHVWTPLILSNGERILVDRGWISLGPGGRDEAPTPPAPEGMVSVEGLLRALPEPGIRLGGAPQCEDRQWPWILNYPTIETVRCRYQSPVINGIILLSEQAPHGFVRNWRADIGMPPMRHYGYAVQWFALGVAVVVVFLVVNMKRTR